MSSPTLTSVSAIRRDLDHGARRGYLWLSGTILLFLLQVVPYLSYRFVTDESWYAGPAYTLAHADGLRDPGMGPNDQENHFDGRPPGTFVAMATAFRLFGTSAATARLASVVAGVAIVALTFALTRDLLGELGAVLACLLLATDNLIVLVSRSARPEALTVMAILAALLALKRYALTREVAWAILAGLLLALGASFHVTMFGYVASLCLLAIMIDRAAHAFFLRGALASMLGWLLGLVPLILWFVASPSHRAGFREEFVGKAKGSPITERAVHEVYRYADLLGTHALPGALGAIPARLPIPVFFLVASYLLWRHRRSWFYAELIALVPTMLWLAYTANKSSRYLSLLAPIFAITIAAAVAEAYRGGRRNGRLLAVLAGLVILMQLAANVVLLRSASKANYAQVEARLRAIIPTDQTAYGTITFWLGLRDGRYISYERTSPAQAIRDYGARYFITGDPMQTKGSLWDQPYYDDLNATLAAITAHSQHVGTVPSPYYGNLEVYRLDDPAAVLAALGR